MPEQSPNLSNPSFRDRLVGFFDPRSIKFKFIGIIVFSFLGFSSFVSFNQSREVFEETKKELFNSSQAFAELSVDLFGNLFLNYYNSGHLTFVNQSAEVLKLNRDVHRVQIIDPQGLALYDSLETKEGSLNPPDLEGQRVTDQELLTAMSSAEPHYLTNNQGNIDQILLPFSDPFGFQPFSVLYSIDYSRADILAQNTLRSIILTAIFSTLAIIILTSLLVNFFLLSPLSKVIFGSKRISSGQLDYQIPVKRKDEIGQLAEAVNFMAAVLRKDIEELKSLDKLKDEFIIIASHNLRTPLTSIKGYLTFLAEDLKGAPAQDKEYLTRLNEATGKLSTLTEELINIVSIKSGQNPLKTQKASVLELIDNSLESFTSVLEKRKMQVTKSIDSLPDVLVDKGSIESVLNNLVDNAIKFSPENGKIEINASLENTQVVISVRDYGVGMDESQLKNLFQKFHRGTESLTYNYEGEGLALYISSLIIQAHGGRIWATSTPKEGSTFSFSLPITA